MSSNFNPHETGFQDEASAVGKAAQKVTQVSPSAQDMACVERFEYSISYNCGF